jgi:3D (Asp-Asp-Asp) domain-containing protein
VTGTIFVTKIVVTQTRSWSVGIVVLALAGIGALQNRTPSQPQPGTAVEVSATAYCDIGKTQSGTNARRGIVAADPRVLPVGSVVRVEGLPQRHNGIYTVMDTGSAVKGRVIDIFMADCDANGAGSVQRFCDRSRLDATAGRISTMGPGLINVSAMRRRASPAKTRTHCRLIAVSAIPS